MSKHIEKKNEKEKINEIKNALYEEKKIIDNIKFTLYNTTIKNLEYDDIFCNIIEFLEPEMVKGLYCLFINLERKYNIVSIINSLADAWCLFILDQAKFYKTFEQLEKLPELGLNFDGWYFLPNLLPLFAIESLKSNFIKKEEEKKE